MNRRRNSQGKIVELMEEDNDKILKENEQEYLIYECNCICYNFDMSNAICIRQYYSFVKYAGLGTNIYFFHRHRRTRRKIQDSMYKVKIESG